MSSYNPNIPAANNNPSDDQSPMQQNFANLQTWTGVDHIQVGEATNYGKHTQITFPDTTTQVTPTNPASLFYTSVGTAYNTIPDLRFINATATFPISLIRCYGVFNQDGTTNNSQAINLSCSGFSSGSGYTMNILNNAVTSNTYGVLAMAQSSGLNPGWMVVYSIQVVPTTFLLGFRQVATSGGVGQPSGGFTCIVFQL